ncbi:type VI secretion system baseplate subunit TssF [Limnoglobus roseus]|uniref:Type VI secretion system baseplate subunit TssF n=1 Tax=Limnoglobus roseus TaxID=2598579 RepID=A0A5C1ALB8_9BACT|nr:type VI secretion system baseplate subunit TssF [Limnoglobus roseus]QEL19740.1 type VI secretion system baseplate subunit TssF [Limnoglobus roseus]
MSRELWPFYDQELRFLQEQAREFSREYPKEAGFLRLEATGRSTDPHVERMLQGFAILSARVRQKLDDDFPELTDGLLGLLYPHYLAPLPSMLIAQFVPNPGVDLTTGLTIARHTQFRTTPVNNVECEYRTAYPTRLWPVTVAEAVMKGPPYQDIRDLMPKMKIPTGGNKGRLRLRFDLPTGQTFAQLPLGVPDPATGALAGLRLFIDADGPLTATLYEMLLNNVTAVVFREPSETKVSDVLPEVALTPVGFRVSREGKRTTGPDLDEGLLPYPPQSFPGYRLLTEFMAYRDKFWFIDLKGWDKARADGVLGKNSVEVHLFLNQAVNPELEQAVNATTFKLGCVPMVNLFRKGSTEGIRVTHQRYDYPLVPDSEHPEGYEIYSVDGVYHRTPSGEEISYAPFYSFRHQNRERDRRYWYGRRRPSARFGDRGTEIDVHFVDCDFNPTVPAEAVALAAVTCCNRDLPHKLRENTDTWSLRPVGLVVPAGIRVLRAPTPTLRPMQKRVDVVGRDESIRKMNYWRLISHLTLNHLSLVDTDPERGREALTEYLALYDFSDDQHPELREIARQVRDGVLAVDAGRDVAFVPGESETVGGYARGLEVRLELDEEKYVGVGSYLFASVMERFFALAVSMNSFTRLTYRTRQRGPIRGWSARAGEKTLL